MGLKFDPEKFHPKPCLVLPLGCHYGSYYGGKSNWESPGIRALGFVPNPIYEPPLVPEFGFLHYSIKAVWANLFNLVCDHSVLTANRLKF